MGVVLPLNPARKWKCSSASPSATTSFPATLPRRSAPSSMACSRSTSPAASATCTAAWMTSSATPTLPRSIGTSFTHTPPSHPTCPRSRDPAIAATLTATPKSRSMAWNRRRQVWRHLPRLLILMYTHAVPRVSHAFFHWPRPLSLAFFPLVIFPVFLPIPPIGSSSAFGSVLLYVCSPVHSPIPFCYPFSASSFGTRWSRNEIHFYFFKK